MKIQRLVIFSGFDSRFVEKARRSLRSKQAEVIFAKLVDPDDKYFNTLLERALRCVKTATHKGARVVGFVASCMHDSAKEKGAFFPAFRRISFPRNYSRDLHRVDDVVGNIVGCFTSRNLSTIHKHVRAPRGILCLPVRNSPSKKLSHELEEFYELNMFEPSASLLKDVIRRRGGGWRIKDLDFKGVVNPDNHPVRRCSDSVFCDLMASCRLGFSVEERFEFDVTCERGLKGKQFELCDGTAQTAPSWASHINMRINGDFKFGRTR